MTHPAAVSFSVAHYARSLSPVASSHHVPLGRNRSPSLCMVLSLKQDSDRPPHSASQTAAATKKHSDRQNIIIYDGQAVEDDQTHGPEQAEDVVEEKTAPELNSESKDVEYANIDFSLLKRRSPTEAARKHESTETEYAEIKKAVKEEREDDGQEEGEMLEGKEEEAMIEENEETNHGGPEKEEGEDMAVYSNVKDIMGEM
ncbi:sialic acid-binding Ig-like lectin 11 [Lates japonicus]|uniref:Sialic acid-binding Ig-like lectin 11 n=1 Tax=Lates japonicus TaxID=270547 RepID=A0AAD3NJD7_LATJO|nr:sialic acid-binding Ig-like lectin 11 [Lates japonicus]